MKNMDWQESKTSIANLSIKGISKDDTKLRTHLKTIFDENLLLDISNSIKNNSNDKKFPKNATLPYSIEKFTNGESHFYTIIIKKVTVHGL